MVKIQSKTKESIKEVIFTLGFAFFFASVIRFFFFQPFYVPSGSMKPNLLIGDYMLVSKYSYGYSEHSFPFGKYFSNRKEKIKNLQRGDVAVFKLPSNTKTYYVKRIMGLAGDKIQFIDGKIYINDKQLEQNINDVFYDEDREQFLQKFSEKISAEKSIMVLSDLDSSLVDNTQAYLVPKGYYFAVGDNRDHSQDSRFSYKVGFIPQKNFIGRAEIILFSFNKLSFSKILRFDRFFKIIN
jgi:signal peptidase I